MLVVDKQARQFLVGRLIGRSRSGRCSFSQSWRGWTLDVLRRPPWPRVVNRIGWSLRVLRYATLGSRRSLEHLGDPQISRTADF